MKFLKRLIAFPVKPQLSNRIVFNKKCIPLVSLLLFGQITHADVSFRKNTFDLDNSFNGSVIQPERDFDKLGLPLTSEQNAKSSLSFGGSIGFGLSYVGLGVKGYVGTPYVRVFALGGLGVGAGVDIKLGSVFELGLTRAIALGGTLWDVAALRYHRSGAFERGWFAGIEYRHYPHDEDTDGTERTWFGTIGYDF